MVPTTDLVQLEAVPGLVPVLLDELAAAAVGRPVGEPGPAIVRLAPSGGLAPLAGLRTARDGFLVVGFDVPRPKALLGEEHLRRLLTALGAVRAESPEPFAGFRFSAAGSDSAVFARLADELTRRTDLEHRPDDGEMVLRVRPGPRGWEVLIRLRPRPLSRRPWRTGGFPGALESTAAAAMVRLGAGAEGPVVDLCCGSGTILLEALSTGARSGVGVDSDPAALAVAAHHLQQWSGSGGHLLRGDATQCGLRPGTFDLVCANPPWGHRFGSHDTADQLHDGLLAEAGRLARAGARLVLISHELRRFQAALGRQRLWQVAQRVQLDLRGHHPCIWVLNAPA
jgi:tRNA (guanine6-N2)-methyltransferase